MEVAGMKQVVVATLILVWPSTLSGSLKVWTFLFILNWLWLSINLKMAGGLLILFLSGGENSIK